MMQLFFEFVNWFLLLKQMTFLSPTTISPRLAPKPTICGEGPIYNLIRSPFKSKRLPNSISLIINIHANRVMRA